MKTKPAKKPSKVRRLTTIATPPILRKILATTDFSNESQAGVHYAVALAKKVKATVTLLHVIEPPSRMSGVESVILAREDSELVALARDQLTTLAKREAKCDVAVTAAVHMGKAFHEITTAAREGTADLIVIATHGYSGVQRVLLGSTAERVVRHAPCPVLTVPAREQPKRSGKTPPFKLKRILVPIDFSTLSKDALPYAVVLAGHFVAEIILVHIVEKFPMDYLLGRELANQTILPLMKEAEPHLERVAEELNQATGVKATAVVREGRPFEEICAAAKAADADMIVLTTHGYTGLKHVWLGSTAERVVRSALCPVLVVRELEHKLI